MTYQANEDSPVGVVIRWLRAQPEGSTFSLAELRQGTGEPLMNHGGSLRLAIKAGFIIYRRCRYSLGQVEARFRPERRSRSRPLLQRESDLIIPDASAAARHQRSVATARAYVTRSTAETGNPMRAVLDLQDSVDAVFAKVQNAAIDLIVADQLRSVALAADEATRTLRALLETL